MAAVAVLAAAVAVALAMKARRVNALDCVSPKTIHLELVSVTADGEPVAGSYDADVVLFNRGPGVVEISARPVGVNPFYSETYRAPAAPAP